MTKALLQVLRCEAASRRPVWFMRQAGRYLPEYRELRARAGSFLDLCYNPGLAAEVTLQPLRRYDLDAAIVFADILVVPHAMGVGLRFAEGEGPILEKIDSPVRIAALGEITGTWQVERVCDTLRQVRAGLPPHVALIGFCGAPWTVASYMIGGGAVEGREPARLAAFDNPSWFELLMERLIENSIIYLQAQIEAGAEVLQIFDSWAGDLPSDLARRWSSEPIARIRQALKQSHPDIPVIVFARGVGAAHAAIARATDANAVSIEPSVPLDWARDVLMPICAVQGNLDPLALVASERALDESVAAIIAALPKQRHIFNLGHGIRQETGPARLAQIMSRIRAFDGDG